MLPDPSHLTKKTYMKIQLVFLLVVMVASCCRTKTEPRSVPGKYFITGVYTTCEEGRFCVAWDTLVVARDRTQRNLYMVSRLSCFQRNLGDEYFPEERVETAWSGVYDEISQVLSGLGETPDLRFIPDQNCLRLAGIVYSRVE